MRWLLCVVTIAALIAGLAAAQTTNPSPASVATQLPTVAFGKLPFIEYPELSPDGTRVAAKLSIGGRQVLAILDLFKRAEPVIIPTGENDLLSWDWVTLNAASTDIAGVRYTSDRARTHWIDPVFADIQTKLDNAVGGRAASIVLLSRDQKQMLVWVGDSSQPGAYYYFDVSASGSMRRFAYVNETLGNLSLGPVSTFRYKARDGLSIEAVLTLPKARDPKNLPLILMPHGGPAERDSANYDWWVQFLASRGYAVVQPSYRGSTGYGESFQKASDGEWGRKMQDDLNHAVADLAAKGVVDPKRVCIVGASYGGYPAMRGAQRDGAKFRCAISYAGVSDLNGMLNYVSRFLYGNTARAEWKDKAPDLNEVSPINHAADFSTPALIIHG